MESVIVVVVCFKECLSCLQVACMCHIDDEVTGSIFMWEAEGAENTCIMWRIANSDVSIEVTTNDPMYIVR